MPVLVEQKTVAGVALVRAQHGPQPRQQVPPRVRAEQEVPELNFGVAELLEHNVRVERDRGRGRRRGMVARDARTVCE